MISLPGGATASPGVRRPEFTIAFGAGGGAPGGALGGLAAAAASAVGLGGGANDPWRNSLVSLTLDAGAAPMVDVLELVISGDSQAPTVAVGDAGSVSLGFADSGPVPVFTGTIDRIRRRLDGTVIVNATNSAPLTHLRLNQSYEQQSAGDIVSDLAGQAGIGAATVENGVTLAFFAVDDRRSAHGLLAELARRAGYIAYIDSTGKLCFTPRASGDPVTTFHYAVDVLALEVEESPPSLGGVTTFGEGAAGSDGADAWAWLIKDPAAVTGTAGSGAPERMFVDPSLRSAEGVSHMATALADLAAARAKSGRLLVPGAPEVGVGAVIEVADAPVASHNGRFLVERLRHRLSDRTGFVTELWISGTGGGGAGGLAGLL